MALLWQQTEYASWNDAFNGQNRLLRRESVRVAAYSRELFLQACADAFGKGLPKGKAQMRDKYADVAYNCGLYHQIGKAWLPAEYQELRRDFSEEELGLYRQYPAKGRLLAAYLQTRRKHSKSKTVGIPPEMLTANTPWLMVRETCQQHMERFDGSGYPAGRAGNQISPIAQIVGLTKELDRLSTTIKGEDPFQEAYELLTSQAGVLWSEELIGVLKNAYPACRKVYQRYIHFTRTVRKTVPLVEKSKERAMGLTYRPLRQEADDKITAYEALSVFSALGDREKANGMLMRSGLMGDTAFYFLYEAADAVLRMENCELDLKGVLLNMLPGFYTLPSQLPRFGQLFADQPIDRRKLMLTISESQFLQLSKMQRDVLREYLQEGTVLVLDGFRGEKSVLQETWELGFRHYRFVPEPEESGRRAETAVQILLDGGVVWENAPWQDQGISEDELIREQLKTENEARI